MRLEEALGHLPRALMAGSVRELLIASEDDDADPAVRQAEVIYLEAHEQDFVSSIRFSYQG